MAARKRRNENEGCKKRCDIADKQQKTKPREALTTTPLDEMRRAA